MGLLHDLIWTYGTAGPGGGGDSDFSTAEVTLTFINEEDYDPTEVYFPSIGDDGFALYKYQPAADNDVICKVPLYNGKCILATMGAADFIGVLANPLGLIFDNATGNITVDMDLGMIYITGDCVIPTGTAK